MWQTLAVTASCYFYPRPPRGGRRRLVVAVYRLQHISIHALCEEGDSSGAAHWEFPHRISIHALCEEGDGDFLEVPEGGELFLSTPSARRATKDPDPRHDPGTISIHALCEEGDHPQEQRLRDPENFYPRPLRGGRPTPSETLPARTHFYPRPLRGGRPGLYAVPVIPDGFLSTPSARRAT